LSRRIGRSQNGIGACFSSVRPLPLPGWPPESAGSGFGLGAGRCRALAAVGHPLDGQDGPELLPLTGGAGALGDLGPAAAVARARPVDPMEPAEPAAAPPERPAPRDQPEPPPARPTPGVLVVLGDGVGLVAGLLVPAVVLLLVLALVVLLGLVVFTVLLVPDLGGRSSGGAGRPGAVPVSGALGRRTEVALPAIRRVPPPASPSPSDGGGASGRNRGA
jgi:hypothetical protein